MLLKTHLVAVTLASLASASLNATPRSTILTSATPSQTLNDCLDAKNVPIKLISSSDWSTYVATYNTRLPYTPAVVVLPLTTKNVADAVTCGAQAGVKIQAKSGGHSYASFSTGGQDGSMVIDMRNFQTISVDANDIATVGAGVRYISPHPLR
jgi:FAD binding domain